METEKNADLKKEERSQIVDLGSDMTRSEKGNIYTLTIIGQIEGHQVAPETVKTTKYEHVLPLLAGIEESDDVDGLLLLLNTVGGDIEAGLAIAEMIAGMKKPTVSLVLGGGHSIGIPLGGVHQKVLHHPHGQHDGAPGADDGASGGRAPDLPVFSADSGTDRGFRHGDFHKYPGKVGALHDGNRGDGHGSGHYPLRQGGRGFRADR